MKKIEKYSLVILILLVLCPALAQVAGIVHSIILGRSDVASLGHWALSSSYYGYLIMLLRFAVNILIGVWLFFLARRTPGYAPWFWLMMGVIAGIWAPILFFIIRIYKELKPEEEIF